MGVTSPDQWLKDASGQRGTAWEDAFLWAAFEGQEHPEMSDQEIIDLSALASLAWMLVPRDEE